MLSQRIHTIFQIWENNVSVDFITVSACFTVVHRSSFLVYRVYSSWYIANFIGCFQMDVYEKMIKYLGISIQLSHDAVTLFPNIRKYCFGRLYISFSMFIQLCKGVVSLWNVAGVMLILADVFRWLYTGKW